MKIESGRPAIDLSSMDDMDVAAEILEQLLPVKNKARGEMGLFSRLGQLVRCEEVGGDDHGEPRLYGPAPITQPQLKALIESRWSFFVNRGGGGGGPNAGPPVAVPTNLGIGVLQNLMALGEYPAYSVPEIHGATEWLTVRPDGTLVTEPGYDPATKVYVRMDPDVEAGVKAVADAPDESHVARAKEWLLVELLGDFEWESPADLANALGVIITGSMRYAFDGIIPLVLLDATMAQAGKGTLAEVMARMFGMKTPDVRSFAPSDEELAKAIVATLRSSSKPFINWDNVERVVEGEALATLLTGKVYSGRVLRSSDEFEGINDRVWACTGNNIRLGKDIRRRSIRVRQKPTHDPREGKRKFRHPDLFGWMDANRNALVWSVGTLVRAWAVAGQPDFSDKVLIEKMGNFKPWARVVGGVLEVAGIEHFLGNVTELQYADDANDELADMIEAIEFLYGTARFTAAELASKFNDAAPDVQDRLPHELRGKYLVVNITTRQMGKWLDRHIGRMCGLGDKRVEAAGKTGRQQSYHIFGSQSDDAAGDVVITQGNGVAALVKYAL